MLIQFANIGLINFSLFPYARVGPILTMVVKSALLPESLMYRYVQNNGLYCCNKLPGNNLDFATDPVRVQWKQITV